MHSERARNTYARTFNEFSITAIATKFPQLTFVSTVAARTHGRVVLTHERVLQHRQRQLLVRELRVEEVQRQVARVQRVGRVAFCTLLGVGGVGAAAWGEGCFSACTGGEK